MLFCVHPTHGLTDKKVKPETQTEQRSLRLGIF